MLLYLSLRVFDDISGKRSSRLARERAEAPSVRLLPRLAASDSTSPWAVRSSSARRGRRWRVADGCRRSRSCRGRPRAWSASSTASRSAGTRVERGLGDDAARRRRGRSRWRRGRRGAGRGRSRAGSVLRGRGRARSRGSSRRARRRSGRGRRASRARSAGRSRRRSRSRGLAEASASTARAASASSGRIVAFAAGVPRAPRGPARRGRRRGAGRG